jgi:hypothetical protein
MDLTLNALDFRIENSEIVIKINGVEAGNITEIPRRELGKAVRLARKYGIMYECIILNNCMSKSIDITYSNLIKLYSIYKKSKINKINNTMTIFCGTEIVAVIVGKKSEIQSFSAETTRKSVAYYYVNCEYKPFVVGCPALFDFCKYLHF